MDPGEECDDGNSVDDDGCSADCRLEDICDLNVMKTADPDTIIPEPVPSCENQQKPHTLTFKYTGGGCAASDNNQPDKALCTGSVDDSSSVSILAGPKGLKKFYSVTPITVAPGEEFTISKSNRLSSNSQIEITNSGGTEVNIIHTSCSQSLAVGDVFGSLTLVAFNGQRGSTSNAVTYTYDITNNGDNLINVVVNDDKLGFIGEIALLTTGETRTFTRTAVVSVTTTNTATVSGTLLTQAPLCEASDSATVTVQQPQGTCDDGRPRELTFEYTGDPCSATTNNQGGRFSCSGSLNGNEPIKVVLTKDENLLSVNPNTETVQIGDLVNISNNSGGTLSGDTKFNVMQGSTVLQSLTIHTSCSQPLNVSDQFGSMILREFIR
jgi:cysteine-rich repeat protein